MSSPLEQGRSSRVSPPIETPRFQVLPPVEGSTQAVERASDQQLLESFEAELATLTFSMDVATTELLLLGDKDPGTGEWHLKPGSDAEDRERFTEYVAQLKDETRQLKDLQDQYGRLAKQIQEQAEFTYEKPYQLSPEQKQRIETAEEDASRLRASLSQLEIFLIDSQFVRFPMRKDDIEKTQMLKDDLGPTLSRLSATLDGLRGAKDQRAYDEIVEGLRQVLLTAERQADELVEEGIYTLSRRLENSEYHAGMAEVDLYTDDAKRLARQIRNATEGLVSSCRQLTEKAF